MANSMRGEAALGERKLVFDFNAMCELELATGRQTPDLLAMMERGLGFADLRHFLWAGLLRQHPGITVEQAGDIAGEDMPAALAAVGESIGACFASLKKEPRKNPRKAA